MLAHRYHRAMDTIRLRLVCAALAAALFPAARATPPAACVPQVDRAWIRLMPVAMPMRAGYARLRNGCGTPVVVVGARSEAFGEVSLHETRIVDGVSRMREVAELPVAPQASVEMKPGGLHLMLMQPKADLKIGARVRVELLLKDGRSLPVDFEARSAAP